MSGEQGWRTTTDAGDYFLHQQKEVAIERRKPVIRKGSDLVGPGIGANAVRLDEYNDLLATFNGYYASETGAVNAPNDNEPFVGYVISDAALGGRQVFTGLETGEEYSRTFTRSPIDPEAIAWTPWVGKQRIQPTAQGYSEIDTSVLSGTATTLRPPNISVIGDSTCYERTDAGISVLRQGIYTGSIQVGDRVSGVIADVYFYRPNGSVTTGLGQLGVPLAPTVHIPFTVWATDGEQGFSVVVNHTAGSARDIWWRFSCTRLGDAV